MRNEKPPIFLAACLAAAFSVPGCSSGPGAAESKMTSYSSSETKADTASLFTVPADQMAHVQVVTVEKSKLPRKLRFSGNVTYNAFKTTPVFSPIGGPVHEILVAPGQTVAAAQPLLTVNSPDYSAARSAYLKARDVDRPIFCSVAVIIAGYLPIYALSGPAGKLFHPMADTMGFALLGALFFTLTLVPVLAHSWFKRGVQEKQNRIFDWIRDAYSGRLAWCLNHPKSTVLVAAAIFGATLLLEATSGRVARSGAGCR